MAPSFRVKLPDSILDILYKCTITTPPSDPMSDVDKGLSSGVCCVVYIARYIHHT